MPAGVRLSERSSTIQGAAARRGAGRQRARGPCLLHGAPAALDEVAVAHATTVAAVALAWLRSKPTVATPIASARTPEQLAGLLPMAALELTPAEVERLNAASAPA